MRVLRTDRSGVISMEIYITSAGKPSTRSMGRMMKPVTGSSNAQIKGEKFGVEITSKPLILLKKVLIFDIFIADSFVDSIIFRNFAPEIKNYCYYVN